MQLKCVGGLADGQLVTVDKEYRVGDIVRVPGKVTFEISSFEQDVEDFRYGRVPKSMSVPHYEYRICKIAGTFRDGSKQELKYLCPAGWHEWEAILHQFGK